MCSVHHSHSCRATCDAPQVPSSLLASSTGTCAASAAVLAAWRALGDIQCGLGEGEHAIQPRQNMLLTLKCSSVSTLLPQQRACRPPAGALCCPERHEVLSQAVWLPTEAKQCKSAPRAPRWAAWRAAAGARCGPGCPSRSSPGGATCRPPSPCPPPPPRRAATRLQACCPCQGRLRCDDAGFISMPAVYPQTCQTLNQGHRHT